MRVRSGIRITAAALMALHVGLLAYGCGHSTSYITSDGHEIRLIVDHVMVFGNLTSPPAPPPGFHRDRYEQSGPVLPLAFLGGPPLPPVWYVVYSLWLGVAVCGITYAVATFVGRGRQRPGMCAECGYDLTGNVSGTCPECGRRIVGE